MSDALERQLPLSGWATDEEDDGAVTTMADGQRCVVLSTNPNFANRAEVAALAAQAPLLAAQVRLLEAQVRFLEAQVRFSSGGYDE